MSTSKSTKHKFIVKVRFNVNVKRNLTIFVLNLSHHFILDVHQSREGMKEGTRAGLSCRGQTEGDSNELKHDPPGNQTHRYATHSLYHLGRLSADDSHLSAINCQLSAISSLSAVRFQLTTIHFQILASQMSADGFQMTNVC